MAKLRVLYGQLKGHYGQFKGVPNMHAYVVDKTTATCLHHHHLYSSVTNAKYTSVFVDNDSR